MNKKLLIIVAIFLIAVPLSYTFYFSPESKADRLYYRHYFLCEEHNIDFSKAGRGEISTEKFLDNERIRLEDYTALLNEAKQLPDTRKNEHLKSMIDYRIKGTWIVLDMAFTGKINHVALEKEWKKSKQEADAYLES